eukprot:GHVU01006336.1.p2 GENE.GHVU01006336.1~~GHVU01006336.1.p2  ORF type:complete len:141 (-),score=23.97 GHVU01006336.1:926-1300(-)
MCKHSAAPPDSSSSSSSSSSSPPPQLLSDPPSPPLMSYGLAVLFSFAAAANAPALKSTPSGSHSSQVKKGWRMHSEGIGLSRGSIARHRLTRSEKWRCSCCMSVSGGGGVGVRSAEVVAAPEAE